MRPLPLTLLLAPVLAPALRAQVGVLDQTSPYPPIDPPGVGGAVVVALPTQTFDQEVRVGVHGVFEGFRFRSNGDPGASVTVRIRPGPASAPGAPIHTALVTRVGLSPEVHFVDCSAAAHAVLPGTAMTLEFQGTGSQFHVLRNYLDPLIGPPYYPFPLYFNGVPFDDGGHRFGFETFTITTPGSFVYYCPGNGTGTPCPCGNDSGPPGFAGCLHSFGVGGVLRLAGTASIAADTIVLQGFSMPNATALYLQGTLAEHSGLGTVLGDGLLCVGGSLIRMGAKTNVAGQSHYPEAANPAVSVRGLCSPGDVRNYQVWFRNAASFCTPATANLTNGAQVVWAP